MEQTLDDLSWADLARGLRQSPTVRDALTARVAALDAVFFECAPVARATVERRFRFVTLPSEAVGRLRPDPSAFGEHLRPPAAAFDNLGHDARLVAPGGAVREHSAHLAVWARHAPAEERHAVWRCVGEELEAWWDRTEAPVWLSTSGLGVPWLHLRLDRRPKYVTYRPWHRWPPPQR